MRKSDMFDYTNSIQYGTLTTPVCSRINQNKIDFEKIKYKISTNSSAENLRIGQFTKISDKFSKFGTRIPELTMSTPVKQ